MLTEAKRRGQSGKPPKSQQDFHELVESLPQIVWIAGPEGQFEYFNRRWLELTGHAGDMDEALRWGLSAALREDDAEAITQAWEESVASGEPFEREFQLRRASDGVYAWYLGRAVAVCDEHSGAIERWIGTATDISPQKRETQETGLMLDHAMDSASRCQTFLREVLAGLTAGGLILCDGPSDLPPMRRRLVRGLALSADTFARLRHEVRELAIELDYDEQRILDLCAAVSEAAMNALTHCGGGTVRVHTDDTHALQIWIEDAGPAAPHDRDQSDHIGHGFALMVERVDRVWLLTEGDGTTVVLEVGLDSAV